MLASPLFVGLQSRQDTRAVRACERALEGMPDPLYRAEKRMVVHGSASGGWSPRVEHERSLHHAEEAVRMYREELVGTRGMESLQRGHPLAVEWRDALLPPPEQLRATGGGQ